MRLALFAALALPALAFAQGSLTPSGAPAATMKTLEQIEARTPIGALGGSTSKITISQSGSYVLMGNVTVSSGDGIQITSSNVTLDLNGFTLRSTETTPAGFGIRLGRTLANPLGDINLSVSNVRIRNGFIVGSVTASGTGSAATFTGTGFKAGIARNADVLVQGVLVDGVSVSQVTDTGIDLGEPDETGTAGTAVQDCRVHIAGGYGIRADRVANSTATTCGLSGINAIQIADSRGSSIGNGYGLQARSTVQSSIGTAIIHIGISAKNALNCTGTSTSHHGLVADNATGCKGSSTSETGVSANSATNCQGSSTSGTGLSADSVVGCQGSTETGPYGIQGRVVSDSYGYANAGSGRGIDTENATNSYGYSKSGDYGIHAEGTASFCRGSAPSGTAISARIAVACTTANTAISSLSKQLGTP